MKKYLYVIIFGYTLGISAQNTGIPEIDNLINMPEIPGMPRDMYSHQQNPNPALEIEAEIRRQQQQIINEALRRRYASEIERQKAERANAINELLEHGFPSWSLQDSVGTSFFHQAFEEISQMLAGENELNLARAVFLIENAACGNTLNYADYQNFIKHKADLCRQKIKENRWNPNNNIIKNMMLFRLLTDTLKFKNAKMEQSGIHLPIRYNYDDFNSKKYKNSHFVTRLMQSGEGQCYSMPLYYLILAEAINAEASWVFSPHHSFIKIEDEQGAWCNLELTCGAILSDVHYINSGYIKAEAIRNKLFLEPMNKSQTVAELLLNLARYYHSAYGPDDFYLQCIHTAEPYLLNNLNALILKSIYEEKLTSQLAYLLDAKTPENLKEKSPAACQHYEQMHALYQQIDQLGYEEVPDALYATWLNYMAQQKEKAGNSQPLWLNKMK
ncbi:MAG: hypothetical protein LBL18_02910 [Bacteroidales bacterium]|jgi:hypothetical protein|nr:hypothetical protein [Bacteroidales bacterium]